MLHKRKKSIVAYLFLACFALLTIGGSGLIIAKRYQIKKTVRAMIKLLPEHELLPVEVNYTTGAENLDEFDVDGEMYDVASYKITGKKIVYYCYYDKPETNLSLLTTQLLEIHNITQQKNQLAHLLKLIDIKYVGLQSSRNIDCKTIALHFPKTIDFLPSIYPEISTPPPQLS
jgi:hypothetical protein